MGIDEFSKRFCDSLEERPEGERLLATLFLDDLTFSNGQVILEGGGLSTFFPTNPDSLDKFLKREVNLRVSGKDGVLKVRGLFRCPDRLHFHFEIAGTRL